MKKESIKLTPAQCQSLEQILSKGKALAWTLKHAQVLLKVDRDPQGPGWSTSQIVEAYDVSRSTVERICRLFREQGLDAALFRRPQPPRPQKRKVDGEAEAHLVAVLCGPKPEGVERWSLRLVREKLVELEIVESISHETVRQVLKNRIVLRTVHRTREWIVRRTICWVRYLATSWARYGVAHLSTLWAVQRAAFLGSGRQRN